MCDFSLANTFFSPKTIASEAAGIIIVNQRMQPEINVIWSKEVAIRRRVAA